MTQTEKKSIELFYTPPKDEYFEELRSSCIRFWKAHPFHLRWNDPEYVLEQQYAQKKIDLLKSLKNKSANFVSMVQMIHPNSRRVLVKYLSLETRNEISMRLYGFEDNEFDPFNIWNIKNNL